MYGHLPAYMEEGAAVGEQNQDGRFRHTGPAADRDVPMRATIDSNDVMPIEIGNSRCTCWRRRVK
jgi:hypothetical protein